MKASKSATTEGYQYLLGMSIQSLTSDTLASLEKNLLSKEEELSTLKGKTIQQIWIDELLLFEKVYTASFEKKRVMYDSELAGGGSTGNKGRGGAKPKKK